MPPAQDPSHDQEDRRLTLTAVTVLAALCLIAAASVLHLRKAALNEIYASEAFAAQLGSKQLRTLMEARLSALDAYLHLPAFRRQAIALDCAGLDGPLRSLVERDPLVERATLTDGEGRFRCAHPGSPSALGKDLSAMDWYRGTRASGKPFVSEVFQRKIAPKHAVVALSAPLIEGGRTRAILVLLLKNQALDAFTAADLRGVRRRALLMDPFGHLAGDTGKIAEARSDAYASLPLVRAAYLGQPSQGRFSDPLDGRSVLGAAEPLVLSGRTWVLLLLQDGDEAMAPMRALFWRLGSNTALALLLAGAGLWVLLRARRRARSLAVTLEAQNEELEQQSEELQQQAEELEQQTEELQQQSEELERQNGELEQQNGQMQRQSAELQQLNGTLRERTLDLEAANRALDGLRAGLEQTVAQRSAELSAKEAQFLQSQKLEAIGRLAGGMAHDFNNLLTVIMGYVELLQQPTVAAELRAQGLKEMGDAAERGSRLTHQLLAFARKQMIEPRPLALDGLVDGLQPMLRRLVEAAIEIRVEHQATDLKVLADPGQLEQVLVNLCVNARDAMPHGGRIDISTRLEDLREALGEGDDRLEPGPYVVLEVRDNGSGMDPEVLKRSTEPFFTTKPQGKGSGLGLSMVHGAVRQAHGQLYIFSGPGKGSVFKIYLPAIRAGGEAPSRAEPPKPAGGHETLLLAEDSDPLRHLAAGALRQAGYTVLEAPDGAGALQALRAHAEPVDLLISDLVMPGGSGLDLARAAVAQRPGLRVLFISGYSEAHLPEDGEAFAWSFLAKPFNNSTLLQRVRECLDQRA